MISASRNVVVGASRIEIVDCEVITPHIACRWAIVNLWRGDSLKDVIFHQRIGARKTLNSVGNRSRVLRKKEVAILDAGKVGVQELDLRFGRLLRGNPLDPASLAILNFD
jgi:hypothetical protein